MSLHMAKDFADVDEVEEFWGGDHPGIMQVGLSIHKHPYQREIWNMEIGDFDDEARD